MKEKEYHREGFVSHDKLGAKYNMDYLLNKVVDFSINNKTTKDIDIIKNKDLDQLKAIIGIIAMSGCRVSEALKLQYNDFILEESDEGKQWLTLTLKNLKGGRGHKGSESLSIKRVPILLDPNSIFFKPFIKPILKWYITLSKWYDMGVWKNTDFEGFPNWTRFRVYYYFYKYLNINPHGLRKIFTTYLVVDRNYPIKVVQRIIGHRDLKNLDYYINLRTEDIKKAILERKED